MDLGEVGEELVEASFGVADADLACGVEDELLELALAGDVDGAVAEAPADGAGPLAFGGDGEGVDGDVAAGAALGDGAVVDGLG